MKKTLLSLLLVVAMLLTFAPIAAALTPEEAEQTALPVQEPAAEVQNTYSVKTRKNYTLASGVTESHLTYNDTSGANPLAGFITTISPSAKVTLKASYSGYYTKGSTPESRKASIYNLPLAIQKTTDQAAAYESATGEKVLFAMNGSFFDSLMVNRGEVIMEGNVVQPGFATVKEPYFAVLKDGTYAIRNYGDSYHDVAEAVGARHWLVQNGKNIVTYEDETAGASNLVYGTHPRTAIGLKSDGSVVCIVIDGRRAGYSVGVTLPELADIMIKEGCVTAVNLDGGGSSTFATSRSGSLTIHNKPTDTTGERTVATSLLLVSTADECSHVYTSRNYTINTDGTHDLICDTCKEAVTSEHRYTSGVCVCGDVETQPDCLFFGFGNHDHDRARYLTSTYGYCNFDAPTQEVWRRGFWVTKATKSAEAGIGNDFFVDDTAGTLSVKVADGKPYGDAYNYGPWVTTTTAYRLYPSASNASSLPLSYNPAKAEIVQIRFKVTGCESTSGTDPRVVVVYDHTTDGTSKRGDYTMVGTYSLTSGEYQTVTIPVSSTFKNADEIKTFGFRFWDIQSVNDGKVTIDYIYVGPAAGDSLLFDFNDDAASQERYANLAYGFYNFDQASNGFWTTAYNGTNKAFSINNTKGTLDLTVTEGYSGSTSNMIYGPWLKTTNTYNKFTGSTTYNYYPLSYVPEKAEYVQIRLKHTGCEVPSGTTPRLVLEYYYTKDGAYAYANDIRAEYTFTNGKYQTITIPVTSKFKGVDMIHNLGLRFQNIKSSTGGTITIDYIYIGQGSSDELYFDFESDSLDQTRYDDLIYGERNFDRETNSHWTAMNNGGNHNFSVSNTSGTLSLKVTDNISGAAGTNSIYGPNIFTAPNRGIFRLPSNANYKPSLYFEPANAEYVQVRFKLENCKFDNGDFDDITKPRVVLRFAYPDATQTTGYKENTALYASYDFANNKYITVTIPVAGTAFAKAEFISTLGFRFQHIRQASTAGGKVILDYIYVGTEEGLPDKNTLFFDFTNTTEDRVRYDRVASYSNVNYDLKGNWYASSSQATNITVSGGTLSYTVATPYHDIYTGKGTGVGSLKYQPQAGSFCQIRFKLDNAASTSNGNMRFTLYAVDENGASQGYKQNQFPISYANGKYYTLTYQLPDTWVNLSTVTRLRLGWNYLAAGTKVTIDYVYVGPENTLPMQDHLLFNFTNKEADRQRYSTKTYGNSNFDTGTWFTGPSLTNHKANNSTGVYTGSLASGRTDFYVRTAITGTANDNLLRYTPGKNDVMQIRMKIDNAVATGSNLTVKFYYCVGGTWTGITSVPVKNEVLNNGYFVAYVPLAGTSYADAGEICSIQVTTSNFQAKTTTTPATVAVDYIYVGPESGMPTQHSYKAVVTAPTCTEKGYTTHTCANCGHSYVDTYVNALGHSYTYKATTKPTTSATGKLTGTCSRCSGTTTVTLPKLNTTDYTYKVTKAATCTATGTGRYTWKTTTYGSFYFDVTIAKISHSYKSVVTAPTCTEQGYTTHTCSACGHSYVDTYVNALGHSYTYKATTKPTTSATGKLTGTCSRCSGTTTVTLPKLNTTDYTYKVTKAATCTATGTGRYTWKTTTYGSFYFDVTIAKISHSYNSVVTAPTCTEQGYTTHTCSACGNSYKDTYVAALGHSYTYKATTKPTTSATGKLTGTCSRCSGTTTVTLPKLNTTDYTYKVTKAATCTATGTGRYTWKTTTYGSFYFDVTIAKISHSYKSVVTAPTCTEQGYTTHTCSACGNSYVDTYTNATGHSYGNWTTVTPATCTTKGQDRRDCGNCDHYETREVAATGHSYNSVVTAPTCTEQGYTTHTCANCGDSYKDTYTNAAGHSYGNWTTVTPATCTAKGQDRRDCGNCDHYETREVAATGHSYSSIVTAPTCTEQGYTTHTCTNCGDSYKDTYTNAAGHSYNDWEYTLLPTCEEKGEQWRDCANCDHSETREVAALGHSYKSTVTEPTCTEQGFTTHTCTNCGDTYVDSHVDAHGHQYEVTTEGNVETHTCIHCGDSYETVIETEPTEPEPTEPEPTEPEETENPNAKNGIYLEDGLYYYYINDQIQYAAGLVFVDGSYYYIRSGGYAAIGSYWVTNTNGITQEGFYIFAEDGKMILTDTTKTGIYLEDGKYYYYIEGEIQFGAGLVYVDGYYYYIRSGGYATIGEYYVSTTNGLLPEGMYTFGNDGRMIIQENLKNGIVLEDDGLYYYYIDGEIQYAAGLVFVDGAYYYIRSGGYAAIGSYWVTNTNNITQEGFYIFAEDGKMILTDTSKNGIYLEDGLYYYYKDGEIQFGAGLVLVDGAYYYIRSGGYAAIGEYYVAITNGLLPEGTYTFGPDGKMMQ